MNGPVLFFFDGHNFLGIVDLLARLDDRLHKQFMTIPRYLKDRPAVDKRNATQRNGPCRDSSL